jgi:dephospho-CoA kinase
MKIFLTGVAGTGKTTALAELQKYGYVVIDLDATGMCRWRNKKTREVVEYSPTGRDYQWLTKHGWYCDIGTLEKLLSSIRGDKYVFVAGITENIEEVSREFNKIFIFTADDSVIKNRLNKRDNNHFAKKKDEQDFVLEHSKELLKKIKDSKNIDANQTTPEVINSLLKLI